MTALHFYVLKVVLLFTYGMPIKLTWYINEDIYVRGIERSVVSEDNGILAIFRSVCYDVFFIHHPKRKRTLFIIYALPLVQ